MNDNMNNRHGLDLDPKARREADLKRRAKESRSLQEAAQVLRKRARRIARTPNVSDLQMLHFEELLVISQQLDNEAHFINHQEDAI